MNEANQKVIDMLQTAMDDTEANATEVLVLMKKGGTYTRYSTDIDDAMEVIAQLEILKYDILRRMYK